MDLSPDRKLATLSTEEIDHIDLGLIHSTDCRFGVDNGAYVITGPRGEKLHCSPRITVLDVWDSAQALQQVADNEEEIEA